MHSDFIELSLDQLDNDQQYHSVFITCDLAGEPELRRGELAPVLKGNATHVVYGSAAFELFANMALRDLLGRNWHKSKTPQGSWTGRTELLGKDGVSRRQLHMHTVLSLPKNRQLPPKEIDRKLRRSWAAACLRTFLIVPPMNVTWSPTAGDTGRILNYIDKNADKPLPTREFQKTF